MMWEELISQLLSKIEKLLNIFDIEHTVNGSSLRMKCPFHESDNPTLGISLKNETLGIWQCFSSHCEEDLGKSLVGFVKGLLSLKENREVDMRETITFIEKFLGNDLSELSFVKSEESLFIKSIASLEEEIHTSTLKITREQVRAKLQIPAKYYLKRGYSSEILDRYDIGLCVDITKAMFCRIVVPVYDINHQYLIGCTARKTEENSDKPKWLHSPNFKTNNCLYNLWHAKQSIYSNGIVVVVESPGNVWKLVESNVVNCVALLGDALSNNQQRLLEKSGAVSIVLLMDNDEAGFNAAQKIKKKLERIFTVIIPKIEYGRYSDIGDMPVKSVQKLIQPVLENV